MADKTVIRVGHLPITDHLILGLTKYKLEKGGETFNHASLETVSIGGWNQVADSLANGEINAAFILAPTAMDLYKSGVPIKMVMFTHRTGSVLITNKRANIQTLEDFAGKVIIIPYQLSVHHMLLHKLLSEKGMVPGKDVMLEVMAPGQMPMAIQYDEEGEVGGFIVAEPFGSQAVAEGYGEEFALSKDIWPNHPCCVCVMTEELTKGHPDAVLELIKSLEVSGRYASQKPAGAAAVGAWFFNQKREIMERVLVGEVQRIRTDELLPVVEDLTVIQDYMCDKMGVLSEKIDLEKFVDASFAQEAGCK
ncbi:MAG: ABC transporter substrate-binding protein [Desulfatibacillum sp.]|nr:ABC transporter substrate-binding protein [Desulfatibacillum sp.]